MNNEEPFENVKFLASDAALQGHDNAKFVVNRNRRPSTPESSNHPHSAATAVNSEYTYSVSPLDDDQDGKIVVDQSSDGKMVVEPSDGKMVVEPSDGKMVVEPNDSKMAVEDEDGKMAVEQTSDNKQPEWDFLTDPTCPLNWSGRKKFAQVVICVLVVLTTTLGNSLIVPGFDEIVATLDVSMTEAIVTLSVYAFASGLGPVLSGPLSETIGRWWVYVVFNILGGLMTIGVGLCHNFAGICILRFLAGFFMAPNLVISVGTLNEIYIPAERGLPSAFVVSMAFVGPGLAPVIGSFVVTRVGWRWTQWVQCIFIAASLLLILTLGRETYHPSLKRKRAEELGVQLPPSPPLMKKIRYFMTLTVFRPLHMLFTEPIVMFLCLYTACTFATQFMFFAAVPPIFRDEYAFDLDQTGLAFMSLVVGSLLAIITFTLCDVFFYKKQVRLHAPRPVPPENRLYPAMIGSVGPIISLFWFGWTAKTDISYVSPLIAMAPFAWGNVCIFVSLAQYGTDCYAGTTTASVASANSFTRYLFAGAFPLFTRQMYSRLGIGWASSLIGFIALALAPVPFVFFKYGKLIRARSKYETATW